MHEIDPTELELKQEARKLSEKYGGVPIVIIAAGSSSTHNLYRTMTASYAADGTARLRDLLGVLEVSKQLETLKHLQLKRFNKRRIIPY